MMASSSRLRIVDGNFSSRRGHTNQLSISDPSHHVTEAIGTMYGDDDDDDGDPTGHESHRPLGFTPSSHHGEQAEKYQRQQSSLEDSRQRVAHSQSDHSVPGPNAKTGKSEAVHLPNGHGLKKTQTLPTGPSVSTGPPPLLRKRTMSSGGLKSMLPQIPPLSPLMTSSSSPSSSPSSPSLRDVQAESQFPLSNMDSPNDIAQELSNLQALRRMSMDVGNNSDPDLLPVSSLSLMAMPSIAPSGDDDEADPSRLLWVPARVHPELEPTAFKNFLENRVQTMKRRSGDCTLSMSVGSEENGLGSLRRKRSMLSRQINDREADGYVDGAERLKSLPSLQEHLTPELSLDELVKDPTWAVQKLAQETAAAEGDMILPVGIGTGLRRSRKTTYRKAGSLRADKVPFSKRMVARQPGQEGEEQELPRVPAVDTPDSESLKRSYSEPGVLTENHSLPARSLRRQKNQTFEPLTSTTPTEGASLEAFDHAERALSPTLSSPSEQHFAHSKQSFFAQHSSAPAVPEIVKTPPADETAKLSSSFPARSSSPQNSPTHHEPAAPEAPPTRSSKRQGLVRPRTSTGPSQAQTPIMQGQSASAEVSGLKDLAGIPSLLPGGGATRTDSLAYIPTFTPAEDTRKLEKKSKDDSESVVSTKPSSGGWKWFKGKKDRERDEEKEREREREREEKEEQARKAKGKDRSHDNVRLDVLQNSIDMAASKGRDSLFLDRDNVDNKLSEERKKESFRKSSDSKKEKDSSFFGGLFGGSKKKAEKDSHARKSKELRPVSPEPPARKMTPDVDYHWTRFSVIEERAIYRMAHLKLANPRRSLHSQVLLSNFMYAYLAKVQVMHPHIQVPISPQQKREEQERKRRQAEQQQQQMREQQAAEQQGQDGIFDFEYHRSASQYGESAALDDDRSGQQHDGRMQYIDDAGIFEYDHSTDHNHLGTGSNGASTHINGDGYLQTGAASHDYYYGHGNPQYDDDDDDDDGDMW